MNIQEKQKLDEISTKIIQYANTKPNPQEAITDFLISLTVNSMLIEREQWESACDCLSDDQKNKIINARYHYGTKD